MEAGLGVVDVLGQSVSASSQTVQLSSGFLLLLCPFSLELLSLLKIGSVLSGLLSFLLLHVLVGLPALLRLPLTEVEFVPLDIQSAQGFPEAVVGVFIVEFGLLLQLHPLDLILLRLYVGLLFGPALILQRFLLLALQLKQLAAFAIYLLPESGLLLLRLALPAFLLLLFDPLALAGAFLLEDLLVEGAFITFGGFLGAVGLVGGGGGSGVVELIRPLHITIQKNNIYKQRERQVQLMGMMAG
jgi:hypothetical protein